MTKKESGGNWVETFKGAVLAAEYDPESTMNSRLYIERFDQATWFLMHAIGITPRTIKSNGRRIAVVRQVFQYVRELRGGDRALPADGDVPNVVMALAPRHAHLIVVDLNLARLYVLKNDDGRLSLVRHHYAAIGRNGG